MNRENNRLQLGRLIYSYNNQYENSNNTELRVIGSHRLAELMKRGSLTIPRCQRTLDCNIVNELKNLPPAEIQTLPFHTPSIQIAITPTGYKIIDGQHRCKMLYELYYENNKSYNTLITVKTCETEEELDRWFYTINKKNSNLAVDPTELLLPPDQRLYMTVRDHILNNYDKSCFPKKDSMHLYFIDDLIRNMRERNIYEKNKNEYNYTGPDEFCEFIFQKNDEFMRKARYEDFMSLAPDNIFYKKEQNNINYGCILNLKRNNFLDYLEKNDDTLICRHIPRNHRKKICKSTRNKLWAQSGGKCYICGINITKDTFEAAHVEPFCESGNNNIENLRPSCSDCNREMGIMNLYEFMRIKEDLKNRHKQMRKNNNIKKNVHNKNI
jgi:hypothetical protein